MTSLVYGLLFASVLSSNASSYPNYQPQHDDKLVEKILLERIEKHENELVSKIDINSLCQEVQSIIDKGIKRKTFTQLKEWDYLRLFDHEYTLHHKNIVCPNIERDKFEVIITQKITDKLVGTDVDLVLK